MKKLQLITKILTIVLISAIAFGGIYVQKQNRMENQVKDYDLGMDLNGARSIVLSVSDETEEVTKDKDGNVVKDEDKQEGKDYTTEKNPVNPDDVKTLDNYNKSKEIIEKRLKKLGINDYIIRLNESDGKMVVEIPENTQTDDIVGHISEVGKFEIVDSEDTSKVLMDNNDIKSANYIVYDTGAGTAVYLDIEFNKGGKEKLKNISTEYATVSKDDSSSENATDSNNTADSESTDSDSDSSSSTSQKKITMQIDGSDMITTSFDDPMENGSLQLTIGQTSTDKDKISENRDNANDVATLLDSGKMPIKYEVESNTYIKSDITKDNLQKALIVAAAIALVALLVLIIKYKKNGILAAIEYIGFVAIYLLLIRYANVTITLEGLSAIAVIFTINYIFNFRMLAKLKEYKDQKDKDKKLAIKDAYKDFWIKAIPICIFSIVFCFANWMPISSFGMTMFWGLGLMAIYNITVAKSFLK